MYEWSSTTGFKLQIWIQFIAHTHIHNYKNTKKTCYSSYCNCNVFLSHEPICKYEGMTSSSWWSSGCRRERAHWVWWPHPSCPSTSWHRVLLKSCCLFDQIAITFLGHCSSFNFHPQYGLLSFSEILCPLNPLTSTHTRNPPAPPHPSDVPSQFFLAFGESYFLLLEYQRSRGMPMEGRVITPKAAQSS